MIVVPAVHPAFIMRRNMRLSGTFEHALGKAVNAAYKGWRPAWNEKNFVLRPNADEVVSVLKSMHGRAVAWDVETDGGHPLNNQLRCIGFYDGVRAITVPLLYRDGTREDVLVKDRKGNVEVQNKAVWKKFYAGEAEKKVLAAIKALLSGGAKLLYTQNGQYDRTVMRAHYGFAIKAGDSGYTFDSMVAHHVLAPYLPHGLGFLGALYTEAPFYKSTDDGKAWSAESDHELWLYCARDCKVTWEVCERERAELKDFYPAAQGVFEQDTWQEEQCQEWKRHGILVDTQALDYFRKHYRTVRDRARVKMKEVLAQVSIGSNDENFVALLEKLSAKADVEMLDDDWSGRTVEAFNPASLRELRLLLKGLKMPLSEVTATGELSTAKELLTGARKELLNRGVDPNDPRIAFLDYLFAWRESSKVESTYLYPEILFDGRVHPNFNVHIVPSGRLSSSDPNFQNQPAEVRGMYVASEDHVLVSMDWDALEMRLGAFLSGDKRYIEVFKQYDAKTGPKPHHANMANIFGLEPTKKAAEANPGMYRAAKVFAYACVVKTTPVATLAGDRPIKDIKPGEWVWTWTGVRWEPTRVKRAWKTGTRACVTVTMGAGPNGGGPKKTLTLTPDHLVMLRDGTYKAAGELRRGDRVMPLRRWKLPTGYITMDPMNTGARVLEHRYVMSSTDSRQHVHHRNGNRSDNRPENLEQLRTDVHAEAHSDERAERARAWGKAQWAEDAESVNARLSEGRRRSPRWKAAATKVMDDQRPKALAVKRTKALSKVCTLCGAPGPGIIKGLCKLHYHQQYNAKYPRHARNHVVLSVEPAGSHEVWDLEVEHEAHNFAAGGIAVHNCAYGAGEETVFEQVREEMPDMSWDSFLIAFGNYKKAYPELFSFMADVVRRGTKNGYLESGILKRRIFFFERAWNGTSPESTAMQNFPLQSSGADIVGLANRRIMNELVIPWQKRLKSGEVLFQLAQVHDELLFEVPVRLVEEFMVNCKRLAEVRPVGFEHWNLPVDIKADRRWKHVQARCRECRELADLEFDGRYWGGTCEKKHIIEIAA